MANIEEVSEGDLVTQNGEYSVVQDDSNGKWYALKDSAELSDEEIENAIYVSDMFDDHAAN